MTHTMTVEELASILGVDADVAKRAIRAAQVPGYWLGLEGKRGRYIIPRKAVERFLAGEWRPQNRIIVNQRRRA